MPGYIFILVLLAVLWLFLIRPRQRQLKDQRRQIAEIAVGDEIVTAGGLYGTVRDVADDEFRVEVAPNVVVRVARRAVAGVVTEQEEDTTTGEQLPEQAEANLPEP
jgi:preprotein translocase subunit YajC